MMGAPVQSKCPEHYDTSRVGLVADSIMSNRQSKRPSRESRRIGYGSSRRSVESAFWDLHQLLKGIIWALRHSVQKVACLCKGAYRSFDLPESAVLLPQLLPSSELLAIQRPAKYCASGFSLRNTIPWLLVATETRSEEQAHSQFASESFKVEMRSDAFSNDLRTTCVLKSCPLKAGPPECPQSSRP